MAAVKNVASGGLKPTLRLLLSDNLGEAGIEVIIGVSTGLLGKAFKTGAKGRKGTGQFFDDNEVLGIGVGDINDNAIPTIGGRKPINNEYAGKTHPSGVKFDEQGFPDFGPHVQATVKSDNLTGVYSTDERIALNATGLNRTPDGYTWHHHQDGRTLQLVPKVLHNSCRHTGDCAVIRNGGSFD